MKVIPIALQQHYDTGATRVAVAMLIRRTDGQVFAFTSHDRPFTMNVEAWLDGETDVEFNASQGLDISSIVTTAGLQVDNMEFKTLDDGSLFDRDDVQAGVWFDAEMRIFRYRWDVGSPAIGSDVETLIRGWSGEVTLGETTISFELRGLTQRLQQTVGPVSTKTCRSELGAVGPGKCNKDLTAFTHNLTVTAASGDKRVFTASGAGQSADYFGEGKVTFTSGANAGITLKVRTFASGVFTLVLPPVLAIEVGDTFTAVAGCRKRHSMQVQADDTWVLLVSDCKTKFDNLLNFQGEPHRPLINELTKPV